MKSAFFDAATAAPEPKLTAEFDDVTGDDGEPFTALAWRAT